MPRRPSPHQPPLLSLGGETIPATWVVDVAYRENDPQAWYAKVYRYGYTYTVGWRPVLRAPARAAILWALSLLPGDAGPVAFRGVSGLSPRDLKAVEREADDPAPFALLDLPSSRSVRRDLEAALRYLEAECATTYTPPSLPPFQEPALIAAAFASLDLDEETEQLYAADALSPRELSKVALRYVFEVMLGGLAPFMPFQSEPLKRLAVRRRQIERVAASYPFLAQAAAEEFYDAWTTILGDIPWPVSGEKGVFVWDLSCR